MDMDELTKFWTSSASVSGFRNFLKNSSTLRDRAFFHNSAHISGVANRCENFITDAALDKKVPVKSHPDPHSGSGLWTLTYLFTYFWIWIGFPCAVCTLSLSALIVTNCIICIVCLLRYSSQVGRSSCCTGVTRSVVQSSGKHAFFISELVHTAAKMSLYSFQFDNLLLQSFERGHTGTTKLWLDVRRVRAVFDSFSVFHLRF